MNVKHALRVLRREPGFAAVTILTLGLGIGANTAIFSVVDGVLLRPAPLSGIERLAMIWETDRNTGTIREPASVPDYLDFKARTRTFETTSALMADEVNLTPSAGDPVRLAALRVTHDLLPMLRFEPLAGRNFNESDDRIGAPFVVMISESLWERMYERSPGVIGQTLRLNETPATIVGVVPEAADFGVYQLLSSAAYSRGFVDRGASRVDVWSPLQPNPESLPRSTHPIFVVGRLAPGISIAAAQDEMTAITADLERTYPRDNANRGAFVESLDQVVFSNTRPALFLLLGAVGLVLLVACVNVANLLLARGASRAEEVRVRSALGAGGMQLAFQFLVENLTLAFLAALAGVAFAFAGLRVLVSMAPPDVPRLDQVTIDLRVLGVTIGLSILIGLVFGMIPTLQARRVRLQLGVRSEGAFIGSEHGRLRAALVVAELAFAVMLVAGAGLLIKSFWQLQQVDPGFRASGVLKAEYQLPPSRYPVSFTVWPNFKEMHAFTDSLLRNASVLPGVESVAIAGNHPMDPGFTNSFSVVGREAEARTWPEISVRRVTPGYFRTVELGLVRGRLLQDADHTFAPTVLVINEEGARRFFEGRDPIGAQIRLYGSARTIVGVVANEKFQGLTEPAPPAIYLPLAQAPSVNGAGVLLVRAAGDPMLQVSSVRNTIRQLDPGLAIFGVEALDQTVSRSISS